MQRIAAKCGRFYRTIPRSVNSSVNNYNKSVPFLQYSSTAPSIGSKTLSNNRDDKVIERSVLQRNGMQSTETKDCHQIESIKFFADENIIQINFLDGQTLNFNTFWLRDSCACPQCVHPLTRTKLFDCADISADLFVDRIDSSGDIIEIQWRSEANDEHISHYSVCWLRLFHDIFDANPERANDTNQVITPPNDGLYASRVPQPERVLWDSTQINKQKLTFNYNLFMNSNQSLRQYLEVFCRFGVAFLEEVPIEKNSILSVVRRIAQQNTTYGSSFEIVTKPDFRAQMAFTGIPEEFHRDVSHRERSPAVQLLHCIESVGGASTLVDGIKCAETLRQTHPKLFELLAENPVLFSFCDKEKGIWFRQKWPIIRLNQDQSVKEIHHSYISMRPPLLPSNLLNKFYESYRLDSKMLLILLFLMN